MAYCKWWEMGDGYTVDDGKTRGGQIVVAYSHDRIGDNSAVKHPSSTEQCQKESSLPCLDEFDAYGHLSAGAIASPEKFGRIEIGYIAPDGDGIALRCCNTHNAGSLSEQRFRCRLLLRILGLGYQLHSTTARAYVGIMDELNAQPIQTAALVVSRVRFPIVPVKSPQMFLQSVHDPYVRNGTRWHPSVKQESVKMEVWPSLWSSRDSHLGSQTSKTSK
ncbi:hypothetical protein BKA70DRAFT_1217464 [Coprinopsis sp. MPI-PUGE-AT-0042]|nr:hypothetical protein BKA70DRAFT_1217464 [Coprinopsis sp. MPI-PUGE-AT-0042]